MPPIGKPVSTPYQVSNSAGLRSQLLGKRSKVVRLVRFNDHVPMRDLVRPGGPRPATARLGSESSIQLSYGRLRIADRTRYGRRSNFRAGTTPGYRLRRWSNGAQWMACVW